jgi:hypothetical protein
MVVGVDAKDVTILFGHRPHSDGDASNKLSFGALSLSDDWQASAQDRSVDGTLRAQASSFRPDEYSFILMALQRKFGFTRPSIA